MKQFRSKIDSIYSFRRDDQTKVHQTEDNSRRKGNSKTGTLFAAIEQTNCRLVKMIGTLLKKHEQHDVQKSGNNDELEKVFKASGPIKLRMLPKDPPNRCPLDAETLLAQSMTALSVKERDQIMEDVHGVVMDNVAYPTSTPLSEDTTFVTMTKNQQSSDVASSAGNTTVDGNDGDFAKHVLQLAYEIGRIPNKQAYDSAYAMSPAYVTNKDFLKLFLEADSYNVKHAAIRIVSYFEFKLELFGPSRLTRDITQGDLSQEELDILYSGQFHRLCNMRDTAGRFIIFARPRRKPNDVLARVAWYMFHRLMLGDAATREKGIVMIVYNNHNPAYFNYEIYHQPPKEHTWKLYKMSQVIPIKFAAGHFCYGEMSPPVRALVNLAISTLESKHLSRSKLHFGSHLEIVHELMSFGIPPYAIPIPFEGHSHEALPLEHRNFLKLQKCIEDELERKQRRVGLLAQHQEANHPNSNGDLNCMQVLSQELLSDQIQSKLPERTQHDTSHGRGVEPSKLDPKDVQNQVAIPEPCDILLGKGRPLGRHPGNVHFRQVISYYGDQYDNCNRTEKTRLATKLIEMIHDSGVRFLKQTDDPTGKGLYVEVSVDVARQKVSHAFRNRRLFQNKEKAFVRAPIAGNNYKRTAAGERTLSPLVDNGSSSILSVNANSNSASDAQCGCFCSK